MEHRFEAQEWRELTDEQKVRRCHFMAREAETLAQGAPPAMALAYKKLAFEWVTLADEIQRSSTSPQT